eukprot:5606-Heterococcus_DN1.PRE.2
MTTFDISSLRGCIRMYFRVIDTPNGHSSISMANTVINATALLNARHLRRCADTILYNHMHKNSRGFYPSNISGCIQQHVTSVVRVPAWRRNPA